MRIKVYRKVHVRRPKSLTMTKKVTGSRWEKTTARTE